MADQEKKPEWAPAPPGPGWYWHRSGSTMKMYIVQNDQGELRARSIDGETGQLVSLMGGEWMGPIPTRHNPET